MNENQEQINDMWIDDIKIKESRVYQYYEKILTKEQIEKYAEYMVKPLPMSFRINMHNKNPEYLQSMKTIIDKYFAKWGNKLTDFYTKDQDLQTTYNFQISRNELRNAKNNQNNQELQQQLNIIHKFIVLMNESGYIQRQEYVSQIPPKLLQPQKGDKILDMCAAPGSKTSQLLEAVGIDGLVIGNDADLKRTHILMHNVTSNACVPQLLLTNLDAAKYPYMTDKNDKIIEFDRIQADVPCSGDGTLRKNVDAIYSWTLQQAVSLTNLQKQILIRAIQLVKNGGYVTYSTCSLNPLEDEAVVSAVINEFRNCPELGVKIEICDPKEIIPHSQYAQGMTEWPVIYNDEIQPDYEHCSEDVKKHITKDFYPDGKIPELVNCCRFYPWLQNSGGFFVALLKIQKPDNFYEIMTNLTQDNPMKNLITKVMKKSLDYKKQLIGNLKSFSAAESRRIPLNPQRRINEDYKKQIQDKFQFTRLFQSEDIQESLNNLSVRETENGAQSFQHVYIQSPYVSQILFSHQYGFELYHIVQAGIQFLHHRNGSYQIETEASYTYDYTKFTYKLNIFAIIELLRNPELSLIFSQINEEIKEQGFSQAIQEQTKNEIGLIHKDIMSQSVNIQTYCTQEQLQELKQFEDLQYVSENINDIINIFNGMKISAFIGKNSIGLNLKKQHKKCLECLLLGEKIEEIIQKNNGKKLSYRQRKEQKRNLQRALKKEEEQQ